MVSEYSNRTVLVTGANSGIGAAIVTAFARQGARIGLHFLEVAAPVRNGVQIGHTVASRVGAEAVARPMQDLGVEVALLPVDLSDPAAIGQLFDSVEAALGPVDILVNNAAHFETPDTVFDVSAGTFDRYFAVNSRHPLCSWANSPGGTGRAARASAASLTSAPMPHGRSARRSGMARRSSRWKPSRAVSPTKSDRWNHGQRGRARAGADRLHHGSVGAAAPADHSTPSPRHT